jgi:hypothetical protein
MYCLNDFEESLKRVSLPFRPVRVLKAWGRAEVPDVCCHMDWRGGFLMELENGQTVYLYGWCDYTGWGCQDGADLYDAWPADDEEAWDLEPADLNRWIENGMPAWEDR